MEYPHEPVLVNEVIKSLVVTHEGLYVDGTVGSGGHSEAIGQELSSKGRLICLDIDSEAIRLSRERLRPLGERVTLSNANYADMDELLDGLGVKKVNGILLDLGISSYQLEQSGRGFSFNRDEPLDMRMDMRDEFTARRLVTEFPQKEIEKILKEYGEERRARSVSRAIVRKRRTRAIDSSVQLANLVRSVIPPSHGPGTIDAATRTFQALRIAVNRELENLSAFLERVPPLLAKGGRLVFLSYHSLEDRLVKQAMSGWEKGCMCPPDLPQCACGKEPLFRRVYKRGIKPDKLEIERNPRARSATLRAAERI